jgi:DNA-binding winged helix-turn-helix (wHTH) protein
VVRYRFSQFTLSPQRRVLVRDGREVPLIPRYFDLLLLLVERRREAVHRREIFDRVWGDVIVSDSALSQAVRTIRLALGDDSREPRFIRTVSRHGYRFVFPDVVEEEDDQGDHVPAAQPGPSIEPVVGRPIAADRDAPTVRGAASIARWAGAAASGGAVAGLLAGGVGGLLLAAAPGSTAPLALVPVLAVIGGGCGALGGLGVGAGLGLGDTQVRAHRALALITSAAVGGGTVGTTCQFLARWGLAALVGLELDIGGGIEGLVIGAAAGLGMALASRHADERLPVPRPTSRFVAAVLVALCCGMAGLVLTLSGQPLVGGTIHTIADAADGSRATLAPLGQLIGEPDFGQVSRTILAFGESAVFGLGLAVGLLRTTARD